MEIRKLAVREETFGRTCDMCGQRCDMAAKKLGERDTDYAHEYGTLSANWGYWSDGRDLTKEECHLCETCFGKVREFIHSQGGIVRVMDIGNAFDQRAHKEIGVDYIRVPGMVMPLLLKEEVIKELDYEKGKE